jgi:hypothetical protein
VDGRHEGQKLALELLDLMRYENVMLTLVLVKRSRGVRTALPAIRAIPRITLSAIHVFHHATGLLRSHSSHSEIRIRRQPLNRSDGMPVRIHLRTVWMLTPK